MASDKTDSVNQKLGVIVKCPSCGGALKAFASTCELCGHELSGVQANRTVSELSERFRTIEAEVDRLGLSGNKRENEITTRKARLIRDFPIPNSRDDLQSLLYFIHPKIQNNLKPDPNAEDWRVKFKEVMTLAKNAYKGDSKVRAEFEELERSLNITLSSNIKTSARRNPVVAIVIGLVAVSVAVGLASTQMDQWKSSQCQDRYAQGAVQEKARLDALVGTVQVKQKEKNYADALATLNQLRWEYKESCMIEEAQQQQARWDAKRSELQQQVQTAEAADKAQVKAKAEQDADAAAKDISAKKKAANDKEW